MRLHKATIVGLQRSKRLIGWYYPIFEYNLAGKEKRIYVRRSGMEITPFSKNKKYTILRHHLVSYERTESKTLPFLRSRIALAHPLMLFLTIPNTLLFLFIGVILPAIATWLTKICTICKMHRDVGGLTPIEGKVICYRQGNKDFTQCDANDWYKPIVEYQLNDHTYYHVSNIYRRGIDDNLIGSQCSIYLNGKSKMVVDEFEVSAPLYQWLFQRLAIKVDTIKSCIKNAVDCKRSNRLISSKHFKKNDAPIVVPLKTLDYQAPKWL